LEGTFPLTFLTVTFTKPPPEDFAVAANRYLKIKPTATDSSGLPRTISQRLDPQKVSVTFETLPKNKPYVVVNGQNVNAPKTLTS
jgi:hypothetical protein